MTDRISIWHIHVIVACFLVLAGQANAQYIDLQLDIDSELTVGSIQNLDFGVHYINSGRSTIKLSSNMGITSIKALENQFLFINIHQPAALTHQNKAIEDTIQLSLSNRYGYSKQNTGRAIPFFHDGNTINVKENSDSNPWNILYIFTYGFINIPDISTGRYTGNVIMDIEYL